MCYHSNYKFDQESVYVNALKDYLFTFTSIFNQDE